MDTEWYNKSRVGHDPLDHFMKFLYKDVKLSRNNYTNHSIYAIVITNLDKEGFEARHIIAVTGHKSESTIKHCKQGCARFAEIPDILSHKSSVDFHTLTLQLPIQTPNYVAPELQAFVSSLAISGKTSIYPWCPESKKHEMCESLGNKLAQKRPRMDIKPQIHNLQIPEDISEAAIFNKNQPQPPKLDIEIAQTAPYSLNINDNIDLFPVDDTTDDMLYKF